MPSDGYALLTAYGLRGLRFPAHLDGEFAIVLADFKNDVLILSTDVFATKPLHYAINGKLFGAATYESALRRLGFHEVRQLDPNTIMTIQGLGGTSAQVPSVQIQRSMLHVFDLHQHKNTTDDWQAAFFRAIAKRTSGLLYPAFIGLSAGYDSGAIAAALVHLGAEHYEITVVAREDPQLVADRQIFSHKVADHAMINLNDHQREKIEKYMNSSIEDMPYRWHGLAMPHKAKGLCKRLHEDGGAKGLAAVCKFASKKNARVTISGIGADEIICDYAENGKPRAKCASAMGTMLWPEDLRSVFPCRPDAYGPQLGFAKLADAEAVAGNCSDPPCSCKDPGKNAGWTNFYGNALRNFMWYTEYVGGAYGIEARYPFLDPEVVQEFLWLSPEVKNSAYKRPIQDLLRAHKYPFKEGLKTGFGSESDHKSHIPVGQAQITSKSGRPMPKTPELSMLQIHRGDSKWANCRNV